MAKLVARIAIGVCLVSGWGAKGLNAQQIAAFDTPSLDAWLYVNGLSPGTRSFAPSFSNLSIEEGTNVFARGDEFDPNRLASHLLAFETTEEIQTGFAPERYQINSVTVTLRSQNGTVGDLLYTEQTTSPSELLTAAQGGGLGTQLPIELFGVGFQNGFEGFALGVEQDGERLTESSPLFDTGGGYNAFPVIGDGNGGLRDVSNHVSGGFSATETSGQTDPFVASPWAVGTVAGLNEGEVVPDDTTFTFELDLTQSEVREYLQQSLADGVVGFVISSLHQAVFPGDPGASPYPQWYTRDAVSFFEEFGFETFAGAEAASLMIDFALLDPSTPGDYDRDGDLDTDDFDIFVNNFGASVASLGDGADGNRDGSVGIADFVPFRDNLEVLAPPPVTASATVVPEPSTGTLAAAIAGLLVSRRIRVRPVPHFFS